MYIIPSSSHRPKLNQIGDGIFFTPKVLHFLQQNFCIILHQIFLIFYSKILHFFTPNFSHFLHQIISFLHHFYTNFFTPIFLVFYTNIFTLKTLLFLYQFFITFYYFGKKIVVKKVDENWVNIIYYPIKYGSIRNTLVFRPLKKRRLMQLWYLQ